MKHGTISYYSTGCRCPECKEACRVYSKNYRLRKMKHGILKTYKLGCKCDRCQKAGEEHDEKMRLKEEKRNREIWALYKGDALIMLGSLPEIARLKHSSMKTLEFYRTKIYAERTPYEKRFILVNTGEVKDW